MSRWAKTWMVLGLLAVVGMAFRVSWNALRDVARSIGADPTAATVYPLVVDGLMALALAAALVLTGRERRFALRVLGGYTAASLVLNYVHGLVPTLHGSSRVHLANWAPANWALVLLASSLPVGSIFFGSDLVAKVLHYRPENHETTQINTNRSGSDLPESTTPVVAGSVAESPAPAPTVVLPVAAAVVEPVRPVKSTAAPVSRPRRATGMVPQSARSPRPTRTPDELLTEARSATAGWSDKELTADRIRVEIRTSAENARTVRDALKAERAERTDRMLLHAVPDPDHDQPHSEDNEEEAS